MLNKPAMILILILYCLITIISIIGCLKIQTDQSMFLRVTEEFDEYEFLQL